jgi:VIT family
MGFVRSFIERFLEPSEWLGELLFGLIMVLTITLGANALIADGPHATRDMLLSVMGCIFAWAVIDALIFMMNSMFERSRSSWLIETIQRASSEEQGLSIVRKELDPRLERISSEDERTRLYRDVLRHVKSAIVRRTVILREDILCALVTFFLVMLTAVPAVVPFLLIDHRQAALRVSNVLLLSMLFFVGYFWAREARTIPWLTGLIVLLIGMFMVGVAKLFGG